MTYLQKLQFLSILALSVSFAPTVYAQSVDNTSSTGDTAYFGVAGVITPEYLGSDDDEFLVLPYLEVNDFKGLDFFGTALTTASSKLARAKASGNGRFGSVLELLTKEAAIQMIVRP